MPAEIIDIHPHIASTDTVKYPVTPIGGMQSDWSKERSVTLEEMIVAMDEAGVDKAAMVHSSTTYGFNNDYVVDACSAFPKRLGGVFTVDVTKPDAPARMRKLVLENGMAGMRIYAKGSKMKDAWLSLDDPATFPAWECAAELGISVAHNFNAFGESLDQIKRAAKRFPTVKMVIDHLGRPKTEDGPPYAMAKDFFELGDIPNVYLKYTPSGVKAVAVGKATLDTLLPKMVAVFGADRIAWGSNFPASSGTLKQILDKARKELAVLPPTDRDWILGGTALKLYPKLAG